MNMNTLGNRYTGALLAVSASVPLPMFTAFLTALLYLWLPPPPGWIILLGLGVTIVVWLLVALLTNSLATAEKSKLADYEIARGDLEVMKAQFHAALSRLTAEEASQNPMIAEISRNLHQIKTMLQSSGLTWVLRTGYIRLWDRINKVKEAMIDMLPTALVIEDAHHAILRLHGSDIAESPQYIQQLQDAISALQSSLDASQLLLHQTQALRNPHTPSPTKALISEHEVDLSCSFTARPAKEQEARSTIRQIQCFLHQYRSERWASLVRARNQLLGTTLLASVLLSLVLDFALLAPTPVEKETLVYASVCYLVGAVVGLFSRLLNEVHPKDAEIAHLDDYGLTGARILATPFLSGLAALAGVPLAVIVLEVVQKQNPVDLANCYNFFLTPQTLLYAAAFGYIPSTLISVLKRQAQKVQGELLKSNPAG